MWNMAQWSCSASMPLLGFACQHDQVDRKRSAALHESVCQAATTQGCWHAPAHSSPAGQDAVCRFANTKVAGTRLPIAPWPGQATSE